MKIVFFEYFILIFLFIIKEIKDIFVPITKTIEFIKNYQIISYFYFKFFKKKNINFCRNKFIKLYTKENRKIWNQNNSSTKSNQKKIIVCSFVHVPGYYLTNGIIGKYLENVLDLKAVGLIDKNDFLGEILLRSFGIDEFLYLEKEDFFKRFKFFVSAIRILKNFKTIDEFLEYNKESVDLGKIVYSHIHRYTKEIDNNKLNFKFFYYLSKALEIQEYYLKLLKEINVGAVIQSETQYIPSSIIFQNSLVNNINVFSRYGGPQWCTVKKYSNISQVYTSKSEIEKNFFDYIFDNFKERASEKGSIIVKKRFTGVDPYNFLTDTQPEIKRQKELTKKELCNLLNWDYNKPICCVFSHVLIDELFVLGWRLFRNNLFWLQETLLIISKIDKINWLIKPHPLEKRFTQSSTNTINEVTKFYKDFKNIKLFPKDLSNMTIVNSVNAVVSCYGNAPVEFASFGIPSIIAARSTYSKLDIANQANTLNEYRTLLANADNLNKLSKTEIEKANTFIYILSNLIKTQILILPQFELLWRLTEYDDNFWKNAISALQNYSFEKDYFRKMLLLQLKEKNVHTINQEFLNKELKLN